MTGEKLCRALTDLDDDLVQEAGETEMVRRKIGNRRLRRAGIAACAALILCGTLLWPKLTAEWNKSGACNNAAFAVYRNYADIYYKETGSAEIKKKPVLLDYNAQNFFSEWKKLNRVSEKVKLLDSEIKSDGYEVRTGSTVTYYTGKDRILNLTLSKEFLEENNRKVLISTLEKTFQDSYFPHQPVNIIVDGKILN